MITELFHLVTPPETLVRPQIEVASPIGTFALLTAPVVLSVTSSRCRQLAELRRLPQVRQRQGKGVRAVQAVPEDLPLSLPERFVSGSLRFAYHLPKLTTLIHDLQTGSRSGTARSSPTP